ncbi:MAG: glycosyltransferase [Pirellulales bacterium]|nr:glycosyltransferase [Pirellulales bacterium]
MSTVFSAPTVSPFELSASLKSLPANAPTTAEPLVSVVIPLYNGARFIRETLKSVLAQAYSNIEIIVVDDGSTDGGANIVRSIAPDAKVIAQENGGVSSARNRGILAATGELIAFLDSDDLWHSDFLSKMVMAARNHPEAGCFYSDFAYMVEGEVRGSRLNELPARPEAQVYERLAAGNFVHMSATLVRRSALAVSGLFDPAIKSAEDYDLWLRLARAEEFRCVEEVLSYYRIHGDNSVVSSAHAGNALFGYQKLRSHHASNPLVKRTLQVRTGKRSFEFAYAESCRQRFGSAARAYFESFRLGHRRSRALAAFFVSFARASVHSLTTRSSSPSTKPSSVAQTSRARLAKAG